MAGYGAAAHTGQIGEGQSIAVFGCGGVGMAALAAARQRGAATIIAVDLDPRKLEMAKGFGATHAVNPNRSEEHTSELQSLMRTSYAVFCLKKKKNQTTQ